MLTLFNQKDIYQGLSPHLKKKFLQYHRENPGVYDEIKKKALALIEKGKSHGEMNYIFGYIRNETAIGGNDGFKLNNNYRSFYTRLFQNDFPKNSTFFKTREKQTA